MDEAKVQRYMEQSEAETRAFITNAPRNAVGLIEAYEALARKESKRREEDSKTAEKRHFQTISWGALASLLVIIFGLWDHFPQVKKLFPAATRAPQELPPVPQGTPPDMPIQPTKNVESEHPIPPSQLRPETDKPMQEGHTKVMDEPKP